MTMTTTRLMEFCGERELQNQTGHPMLERMRNGAALHLHFDRGGPVWVLSGGREVLPDTVKVVIARPTSLRWTIASSAACTARPIDGLIEEGEL